MPQIGWVELLLIVVIAILVIGPKDFPKVLNKIGSWVGSTKRYFSDVQKNVNDLTNIVPELMIKEGITSEKIIETLEEDNAIRFLVLAAAESDQPGPLVSLLAGQKSGKLPVPIVIIPQGLSDELIDDLASRSD